jgi:hypothetical protein
MSIDSVIESATKNHPINKDSARTRCVSAGRAFALHYKKVLTTGQRGVLRRAEIVSTNGSFWDCVNKAKAIWPEANEARCVRILETLVASGIFEEANPVDDMTSVGGFMKNHKSSIKGRRVEAMLAASARDAAIDEFTRLVSIAKSERGTAPKVDFGVLFNDLVYFGDRVRRSWASDCFN